MERDKIVENLENKLQELAVIRKSDKDKDVLKRHQIVADVYKLSRDYFQLTGSKYINRCEYEVHR